MSINPIPIITTNHETIQKWVETRNGKPITLLKTRATGEMAGEIQIYFPGQSGGREFEEIPWESWFAQFDSANIAFEYEEAPGSTHHRFVPRD